MSYETGGDTEEGASKKARGDGEFEARVLISSRVAGAIIGKGGAAVKNIREQTSVFINILRNDTVSKTENRVMLLRGTPETISSALFMMSALIAEANIEGTDATTWKLLVHAPCCGTIIGKSGATIKQLMTETGANIQFSKEPLPNSTERECTIGGTAEQIHATVLRVLKLLHENPPRGSAHIVLYAPGQAAAQAPFQGYSPAAYAAANAFGAQVPAGAYAALGAQAVAQATFSGPNKTAKITIPTAVAGTVIGKGGATIKGIKEQSGCQSIVIDDPEASDPENRVVKVTGPTQGVQYALQLIRQKIEAGAGPSSGASSSTSFTIPTASAGMVIGKGGSTIQNVKAQSGCTIVIADADPANPAERTVTVTGSSLGIQTAVYMIQTLAEGQGAVQQMAYGQMGMQQMQGMVDPSMAAAMAQMGGDRKTQKIAIPTVCAGLVIGRGGATIRDIIAQSGCTIVVADPDPMTPQERAITVTGSAYAIQIAIALITQKVESYTG